MIYYAVYIQTLAASGDPETDPGGPNVRMLPDGLAFASLEAPTDGAALRAAKARLPAIRKRHPAAILGRLRRLRWNGGTIDWFTAYRDPRDPWDEESELLGSGL